MIEFKNLSFAYGEGNLVLSGINAKLKSGHIYGLLGRNGVGKSTLLKLIAGYIFPKSGNITTLNSEPKRRQPSFLSEIFFITEELDVPELSMRRYAKLTSHFYPNFSMKQLEEFMEEFQVSMDFSMNKMSHGQRKKAIVSFGLACNTKILIMDEPTNGMDIPSKSQFRKIITSLSIEDRCIIISTHQIRDLDNIIDAILIIEGDDLLVNSSLYEISKKLTFGPVANLKNSLYHELSLRGDWGVEVNNGELESRVDIEIFFNMAIANQEIINQLFNK